MGSSGARAWHLEEENATEGRVAELEAEEVGTREVGHGDFRGGGLGALGGEGDGAGAELLQHSTNVGHKRAGRLDAAHARGGVLEDGLEAPEATVEGRVNGVALRTTREGRGVR